jgi:hypothetical protein
MSLSTRIAYRIRQFRLAFSGRRRRVPDEALSPHLSPNLITLFRQMTPSEQAHSRAVLERLQAAGQDNPDLLAAALLHDVGKTWTAPLSAFDRALIVLGKRFLPEMARRRGEGELHGAGRPFVVAAKHAAWGAELAAEAGASERTCELIRRHQDMAAGEDSLLRVLQEADDLE